MKVAWKVFKVVVIVVLFLVSVFFLYKGYLVYFKYHIRNFQYIPVQGEKAILTSKECSLSLGDFSICLPDSFSLDVDKTYVKDGISYFDSFGHVIISVVRDNDLEADIRRVTEDTDEDFSRVINRYQIYNLMDILHYLDEHMNDSISVLSSVSDIQMSYISKKLVDANLPNGDVYYLSGNYQGYLVKQSRNYYIYIYHDDKIYEFTFLNSPSDTDYFNDDIVLDILSSVRFKVEI